MYYLNFIESPRQLFKDISKGIYGADTKTRVTDACFVEISGKCIALGITKSKSLENDTGSLCRISIIHNRTVQFDSFTDSQDISPVGITTGGCQRVFVSDARSECICVYDLNGKYKGPVLRKGEQGSGKPGAIRWCKDTTSLVISHHGEKLGYRITVLKYF